MTESNIDDYLADDRFGTLTYLLGQRKAGRIRHLSFSCHGALPVLEGFLEKYGKDMEFCQLQLNYIDWHFQKDVDKVALLARRPLGTRPLWRVSYLDLEHKPERLVYGKHLGQVDSGLLAEPKRIDGALRGPPISARPPAGSARAVRVAFL